MSKVFPEVNLNSDLKEIHEQCEIVFVGFHRGAKALLSALERYSPHLLEKILVIDFNPLTLEELKAKGIKCIFGDIGSYDTLVHAHIYNTKIVLSTIPDLLLKGTSNKTLVEMVKSIVPKACIVCTAEDYDHQEVLLKAGADVAVLPYEFTGEWLAPLVGQAMASEKIVNDPMQKASLE